MATPKRWLVAMDYGQIEMRVAAHQSQCGLLIERFLAGIDIHSVTASDMFEIPIETVDEKAHRYPAKRAGFGILYKISAYGLQRVFVQSGIPEKIWPDTRCQWLIDNWYALYPEIAPYQGRLIYEANKNGYVTDACGRRRYVSWIHSPNKRLRKEAEKQACNADIQSTSQQIIKQAMVDGRPLYAKYNKGRAYTQRLVDPLIQVHDELVFSVADEILEDWVPEMKAVMVAADKRAGIELDTGIKVDVEVSETNWAEIRDWSER